MDRTGSTEYVKWDHSGEVRGRPVKVRKIGCVTSLPGSLTYSLVASDTTQNGTYVECLLDRAAPLESQPDKRLWRSCRVWAIINKLSVRRLIPLEVAAVTRIHLPKKRGKAIMYVARKYNIIGKESEHLLPYEIRRYRKNLGWDVLDWIKIDIHDKQTAQQG